MKKIEIRSPIWATRSIGIARYKVENSPASSYLIEITYKNKEGERIYPETFVMTGEKIMSYPTKFAANVKLHIIPIKDLIIYEEHNGNNNSV